MLLNDDKSEVYLHCCLKWLAVNLCLWLTGDDGIIRIYCPEHEQVLLGFDKDLI